VARRSYSASTRPRSDTGVWPPTYNLSCASKVALQHLVEDVLSFRLSYAAPDGNHADSATATKRG
jgi:hypothetical protein